MQIHVARNGQQTGPYDEAQVRAMLGRGEIAPTDLAWHADLTGWQPLASVFPDLGAAPAAVPVRPAEPTPAVAPYAPPAGPSNYAPLPVAGGVPGQLPPPQFYNPAGLADPNLAGLGARFLGAFIDGILLSLCILPGYVVLLMGASASGEDGTPNGGGMALLGGAGYLFGILVYMVIQGFLLSRSGQSIGKKIAGTRVVRVDGSPAGFVGAFLMRSIVAYLPNLIPLVNFFYGIVDICFIFRADRRCIHDLIAGTKVIRAK